MSNGNNKYNAPITGIGAGKSSNTEETQPTREQQPLVRPESDAGIRTPREGFQRANLADIARNILRRMDTAGGALVLKLPGIAKIIHDRRAEGKEKADAERTEKDKPSEGSAKTAGEMRIRDGKTQELKQKTYENYLAAREMVKDRPGKEEVKQERKISEFEKMVIERFEEGKQLEQSIKDGKAKFLEKTVEQWRAFFEKFMGRTAKQSADMKEIQEFLYRGLVKKDAAKAVLISDIILSSGKTEKFARFSILHQKLSDLFAKLMPGDTINKANIADGLLSEKLLYLALQPPSGEKEFATGMQFKQGIFSSESTEARIAAELGIISGKDSSALSGRGAIGKGRRRKIGGWFSKDDEPTLEDQGRFMPWWQWGNLNRPGGLTTKRAFYSGVIIIFIIVVLYLLDRLVSGGG